MRRVVDTEQFFTDPEEAAQCVAFLDQLNPLHVFSTIVEPSAGDGAFLQSLPSSTIAIDIDPRDSRVKRADFLRWKPPAGADSPTLVIGNPPFGQRGALAIRFIAHACTFADVVAFILPQSFRKYTFHSRIPGAFHLVAERPCGSQYRSPDGSSKRVNTVFQVWERRPYDRVDMERAGSHPDFDMAHAHMSRVSAEQRERLVSEYDFAIPQAGSVFSPRDTVDVIRGSYWFIRGNVPGVRERFDHLDFGFLENMNTAHTSLSKRDIVAAYTAASNRVPAMSA